MTTQRRGGAGCGIRIKKKARCFMFCCGGSNAVSISDGSDRQSPMATPPANMSSTTTIMSTTTATGSVGNKAASSAAAGSSSFSPSSSYTDTYDADADTSVAALLQQLSGRERSVRSMQGAVAEGRGGRRQRRTMIVEKEIVGGAELRELLHRFLSLNSPHHHHVILRAFAEIWEEVFAGYQYQRTPDLLVSRRRKKKLSSYAAAADDKWTASN
ncbi:hypothetical protein ABZP36_028854 [Zizania latifolia]